MYQFCASFKHHKRIRYFFFFYSPKKILTITETSKQIQESYKDVSQFCGVKTVWKELKKNKTKPDNIEICLPNDVGSDFFQLQIKVVVTK